MSETLELAPRASREVAMRETPTPGQMMQAIIDKGITQDSAAALEKLAELQWKFEARNAEREFATAFVSLQTELPTISGTRPVPARDGTVKYRYANFDDIDAVVRPICLKHGFTYAFREGEVKDGRVTVIMTLQHACGHSREVPYSVRIGQGPPGSTESQADVSGHSYAQRGALESGLSLRIIGQRDNAGNEAAPITQAQADELERRVALLNQDHKAFLKWLGADTYAKIPSNKYEMADSFLAKKEKNGK